LLPPAGGRLVTSWGSAQPRQVISPTHKRTELGLRVYYKSRYTTGGFGINRSYAEREIVGFGDGGDWWRATFFVPNPLFESIRTFENNFESSPKNLAWASEILFFTTGTIEFREVSRLQV